MRYLIVLSLLAPCASWVRTNARLGSNALLLSRNAPRLRMVQHLQQADAEGGQRAAQSERLPKSLLPITLSVFVQLLGEGIAISTLPLHMQSMGASAPMVGAATSCFSVMQMICCPIAVRVSSRIGRQRMLRVCLAGASAAQALIGLSPSVSGILIGRLLNGIFSAAVPVAQAGVTDLVPPRQSALALSRVSAAAQSGVVVGPLISAAGAAMFASLGVPAHMRVRAVFLSSALFALIVLALSSASARVASTRAGGAFASPPMSNSTFASASNSKTAAVTSWYDQGVRLSPSTPELAGGMQKGAGAAKSMLPKPAGDVPLPGVSALQAGDRLNQIMLRVVALACGWSLTLCVSTYCLFGSAFLGYKQPELSATFSAGAACTIITQIAIFPRLVKRVGEHAACAIGLVLLSMGLGGSSLLKIQPFHTSLYLAARVGAGVADTSTATLVARSSRGSDSRARNLGLIQSTRAGARIITPVLSGWLFQRSRKFAFAPGALPYLLVASLLVTLMPVPFALKRFEQQASDTEDRG